MRASHAATVRLNLQALEDRTVPNGGRLDWSFGGDGMVTDLPPNSNNAAAQSVLVQPDGKVVLVGWTAPGSYADPTIVRLTSEGVPDPTFGTAGVVTVEQPGGWGEFTGAALMASGEIIATGVYRFSAVETFVIVARFRADGSPDPTFGGGDGVALTPYPGGGGGFATPVPVALQPDGRVVLAVRSENPTVDWHVLRYAASGDLDLTFSGDGLAPINIDFFYPGLDDPGSVCIQPDGKVIVAGTGNVGNDGKVGLARINPDGSPDLTFGDGGGVLSGAPGWEQVRAAELLLLPGGKVLVIGSASDGNYDGDVLTLFRFNPDGSLDPTFDGDGIVVAGAPPLTLTALAVAQQGDDRIVVAGFCFNDYGGIVFDSFVARFMPDGSLDSSFGPAGSDAIPGIVITDVGLGWHDVYNAVAVQADGRIVAAGQAPRSQAIGSAMSAARYFAGEDPNPHPEADTYQTDEGTPLMVPAPGLLANDTLPPTGASAVLGQGAAHGVVTLNADGSFSYAPTNPDYNGPDSFTYRLAGTDTTDETATVRLTIRPVNDAPVANPEQYTLPAVGPLSVPAPGILVNDSDIDGDALTAFLVDPPPVGTLTLNPNGSFTYAFPEDLFGPVTFTYGVTDSILSSTPVPVTLRRGSAVTAEGGTPTIVGTPGPDFVRLRPGLRGAIRVELQTPEGITRTTLKPPPGVRRFSLVNVYLGDGDDRLDAAGLPIPVRAFGGAGNDYLRTGARADEVYGDQANGTGAGNDVIETALGNDRVVAGDGHDLIDAGAGRDTVTAGSGGSFVDAGAGNDEVTAAGGSNWLLGGAGRDVLLGGTGSDLLDGGLGNDLIAGGLGGDTAEGGTGHDLLFDGGAAVKDPATDSLAKVLASYVPTRRPSLVGITNRLAVTSDPTSADHLLGGLGVDWFWTTDTLDITDRLPAEPLNGVS